MLAKAREPGRDDRHRRRAHQGLYLQPTLVTDVRPEMDIFQEEVFGPVLTALPFDDDRDAVALANFSQYGLVAGVWTRDLSRAHRVAHAIHAGQVFVNTYGVGGGVELPFGGMKRSGYGRGKGIEALLAYSQVKNVCIRPRQDPFLIVILGSLVAIGPLSIDMYLPGLPEITRSLDATAAAVQLSLTACVAGLAVGQLIAGPLSDRLGRRRPLITGLVTYSGVSLLCALAPTVLALTGLRFLQGLAGGAGIVIGRAVVRDLYSGAQAAKLFSSLMLVTGLAPILAPVLGAQILKVTTWQGIFVVLAALSAAIVTLAAIALPETLPRERRDPGGNTLHTMRHLLTQRSFLGYALTAGLAFGALFAYISGSPFVLPGDLRALAAGLQLRLRRQRPRPGDRQPDQRAAREPVRSRVPPETRAPGDRRRGGRAGRGDQHRPRRLAGDRLHLRRHVHALVRDAQLTALALAEHGAVAGTASALLGVTQFLIGGLAAPLVGIGGTGSALPMAVVMLSLASGAVAGEPMALIAISAPYGAGGSQIAPALAERLGVPFLDRPADTEPDHGLLSKLSSIGLAWGTPAGMELEDLVPGETRRREIEAELAALEHGVRARPRRRLPQARRPDRAARAAPRPAGAADRAGDADGGHRPPHRFHAPGAHGPGAAALPPDALLRRPAQAGPVPPRDRLDRALIRDVRGNDRAGKPAQSEGGRDRGGRRAVRGARRALAGVDPPAHRQPARRGL